MAKIKYLNKKQQMAYDVRNLTQEIMNSDILNLELCRHVDRLARQCFIDIDVGWVRWSYYILTNFFNNDYKKYDQWAEENCQRTESTKDNS